jgi:Tol biopolymer transport system component
MEPRPLSAVIAALAGLSLAPLAGAAGFGPWSHALPVVEVNSAQADGCPIEAPDGRRLFIASNRPGTLGGNDIWVAERDRVGAPWGAPRNLGAPVNSAAADFCPTPLQGNWLLFVSERAGIETCSATTGSGDIYLTQEHPVRGYRQPAHLGCDETDDGPNSNGAEFSPSLLETEEGTFLYFSSTRGGNMDIWSSRLSAHGFFETARRVEELSTSADDRMPNVRRDGLEVVFSSNRPGAAGQDVYVATRASTADPWGTPVNLGPAVNTAGAETRASLSRDGMRLYFGRDGEIYSSSRTRDPD